MRSRNQSPVPPPRSSRRFGQLPSQLAQSPVRLPVIAPRAAGDAVLPGMSATTTARYDMVDGLGALAAVRAPIVVTLHQRRPAQRHSSAIGHLHEGAQPDHRGHLETAGGRVQRVPGRVSVNHLGLTAHDQHDRAAQRQRGERLEGRVEQQHAPLPPGRRTVRQARNGPRRQPRGCAGRRGFSVGHSTTSTGYRAIVEHKTRPERTCDPRRTGKISVKPG